MTGKETVAQFGEGDFPDGLTLDMEGGAWVVCVGSNRVGPDGQRQLTLGLAALYLGLAAVIGNPYILLIMTLVRAIPGLT